VHNFDGSHALHYEGNWRDIFQNWEALSWSWPEYLPHFIAKFVNASTVDGFNPYRIDRGGIDWEVVDADDPWSNIGYWGDHQIVYLLKFLETLERFDPDALGDMLGRCIFSYADVPYRLKSYDDMVRDPHDTITFDRERATEVAARVDRIGSDGRLVVDAKGGVFHANLVEKLLVPALSKLSNLVVDAGIWMNTQRPEWNDANNALVGNGVSMVTLCYLRRYLAFLDACVLERFTETPVSSEVATWLREVTDILEHHRTVLQNDTVDDEARLQILEALGRSFERYRVSVTEHGFSDRTALTASQARKLCRVALQYLDHAIAANRCQDGLYHSYNLIEFSSDADGRPHGVAVHHLDEMLEGQVAVMSSGVLPAAEVVDLVDTMYASALYRPDQNSFLLYPDVELPGFMERNVVPPDSIKSVALLRELVLAGETSLVERDALGVIRFQADIENADDVHAILDRLAQKPEWSGRVEEDRSAVLAVFESVFQHKRFTGRSGTMYAYEGLGSIYWHMVSKLLLAVQENVQRAVDNQQPRDVVASLAAAYRRIRSGLGFTKSVGEFGAIPTDPYSHTPSYAGAQQPGMTGDVKEQIITRFGELGVTVTGGQVTFRSTLLSNDEFLERPVQWEFFDLAGRHQVIDLPAGRLAFSFCQTPVVCERSATPWIRVVHAAQENSQKETSSVPGDTLDVDTSRKVFTRSGSILRIEVGIPPAT
jgi:hypothetical protein